MKAYYDSDDLVPRYDVKFEANGYEYEYDVKASDGAVLEYEYEINAESGKVIASYRELND